MPNDKIHGFTSSSTIAPAPEPFSAAGPGQVLGGADSNPKSKEQLAKARLDRLKPQSQPAAVSVPRAAGFDPIFTEKLQGVLQNKKPVSVTHTAKAEKSSSPVVQKPSVKSPVVSRTFLGKMAEEFKDFFRSKSLSAEQQLKQYREAQARKFKQQQAAESNKQGLFGQIAAWIPLARSYLEDAKSPASPDLGRSRFSESSKTEEAMLKLMSQRDLLSDVSCVPKPDQQDKHQLELMQQLLSEQTSSVQSLVILFMVMMQQLKNLQQANAEDLNINSLDVLRFCLECLDKQSGLKIQEQQGAQQQPSVIINNVHVNNTGTTVVGDHNRVDDSSRKKITQGGGTGSFNFGSNTAKAPIVEGSADEKAASLGDLLKLAAHFRHRG